MALVRLLFIGMLAVHLVGAPAAVVSPCSVRTAGAHSCCMRHQTANGGAVIGRCDCQAAPASTEDDAVLSMPVPSPETLVACAPAAGVAADSMPASEAGFSVLIADPPALGHAPPRLTGAGFRC
jgi:hypothetical protein